DRVGVRARAQGKPWPWAFRFPRLQGMMFAAMKTASGRITMVQEQRFRLTTDGGQSFLLTVAHDASLDGAELCRLRDGGARVIVDYDGEPGWASGVAHSVRTAADAR
ncbi:MAG TPA: hypothetical protein VEQ11_01325, partial [Chloroflexota bacterium]|nr:hypothetical protein [Chloroflexota bacterium]